MSTTKGLWPSGTPVELKMSNSGIQKTSVISPGFGQEIPWRFFLPMLADTENSKLPQLEAENSNYRIYLPETPLSLY